MCVVWFQIDAAMRSLMDAMTRLDVTLAADTDRYVAVCLFILVLTSVDYPARKKPKFAVDKIL